MKCVLFGVATLFLAESHLIGKTSPIPHNFNRPCACDACDDDSFEEGSSESSLFSRFDREPIAPGYRNTDPRYSNLRYPYGNDGRNFYGDGYGYGNIYGNDYESDSFSSSDTLDSDLDSGINRNFDGIYNYRYT